MDSRVTVGWFAGDNDVIIVFCFVFCRFWLLNNLFYTKLWKMRILNTGFRGAGQINLPKLEPEIEPQPTGHKRPPYHSRR